VVSGSSVAWVAVGVGVASLGTAVEPALEALTVVA
jgi:hypothetical protein